MAAHQPERRRGSVDFGGGVHLSGEQLCSPERRELPERVIDEEICIAPFLGMDNEKLFPRSIAVNRR